MFQIILDNYEEITGSSDKFGLTSYYEMFKTVMMEKARREYISMNRDFINGYNPTIYDAVFVPMDNDLLKEELETMAHFAPKEPAEFFDNYSEIAMKMSDFKYYFDINYEDFGGGDRTIGDLVSR